MTSSVVPTRATAVLAATMIATARREGSGAEAVILHLDDLFPDQYVALVGLLLNAVAEALPRPAPLRLEPPKPKVRSDEKRRRRGACAACDVDRPLQARGLCSTCYQRHRYRDELDRFPSAREVS